MVAIFTISCAGIKINKDTANRELQGFLIANYPPTSGSGEIHIKSGQNSYTGFIFLAIDGNDFRIEIIDMVGRTTWATACDGEKIIDINTSSGEKKISKKPHDGFISLAGFKAPYALISSMITGAPPKFDKIDKAILRNGKKIVSTVVPEMEIEYTKAVDKISFYTYAGREATLTFGERATGPVAPYVRSVTVSFPLNGGKAEIKWADVRQNVKFEKGFFSFNETPNLF